MCSLYITYVLILFCRQYDTSVDLPRPPVYLEGGYTQWYLHYSPVCVGVWKLEAVDHERREEDGRRGEEDGRGGGRSGEKTAEGKKPSFDYPSFPEFRYIYMYMYCTCVHCESLTYMYM